MRLLNHKLHINRNIMIFMSNLDFKI